MCPAFEIRILFGPESVEIVEERPGPRDHTRQASFEGCEQITDQSRCVGTYRRDEQGNVAPFCKHRPGRCKTGTIVTFEDERPHPAVGSRADRKIETVRIHFSRGVRRAHTDRVWLGVLHRGEVVENAHPTDRTRARITTGEGQDVLQPGTLQKFICLSHLDTVAICPEIS